jgi:hypothetical protein
MNSCMNEPLLCPTGFDTVQKQDKDKYKKTMNVVPYYITYGKI